MRTCDMSATVKGAVSVYTHRHGTDVSIYPSKELAQLGLVLVLLDNINTGDADDQVSLETQKEIVQAYHDGDLEGAIEAYNRDSDDETMFVTECHDDGVPEHPDPDFLEQLDRVLGQNRRSRTMSTKPSEPHKGDSVFGPRMPRELDQDERAAIFWLSTNDGFGIARSLTRETLMVVYANLVAAGHFKERPRDVASTVPEVRDVRPDPEG